MIIVNFATKHYMRGQRRLSESLNGHKQLMLSDYVSLGSPDHSDSPYAFKCYAIESALNYDDIVIWADSSMKLVGDLSKIETIIKEDGYFFQSEKDGHFKGPWDRHRHDMVCGSILAEKHGMKYQRGGSYIAYIGPGYQPPEPGIVFTCQGII
jgi:hypothetical protein